LKKETQAHGSIEQDDVATRRGATDSPVEQGLEVEDRSEVPSQIRGNAKMEG